MKPSANSVREPVCLLEAQKPFLIPLLELFGKREGLRPSVCCKPAQFQGQPLTPPAAARTWEISRVAG